MSTRVRAARSLLSLSLVVLAGACAGSAPTSPSASPSAGGGGTGSAALTSAAGRDSVATQMDALSTEAHAGGSFQAGQAFGFGAAALRGGVDLTPVTIRVGIEDRQYVAFATSIEGATFGPGAGRSRSLVAYRGGERPTEVLMIMAAADDAPIGGSFFESSTAMWINLGVREAWRASSGRVGGRLLSEGSACPAFEGSVGSLPEFRSGFGFAAGSCRTATFAFTLDGVFARASAGFGGQLDLTRTQTIRATVSGVNGIVMKF